MSGLDGDDLRAAVSAGILTERQATRLTALADARRGARAALAPGEEPFELFRGFNEIFIVLGLAILSSGWAGLVGLATAGSSAPVATVTALGVTGALILWALSEYLIRRRRMVAPAIALSLLFGANALLAASVVLFDVAEALVSGPAAVVVPMILVAAAASGLHFARFRVPFTLAQIAVGLFAALVLGLSAGRSIPDLEALFRLGGSGPYAWATLGMGLGLFALAMAWDMSDPHRVTRRSANGFWLHVVAAPAIVNTVAVTLLAGDPSAGRLAALGAFLVVIALVAVVIDRRSFLVSGAGYTVVLAGFVGEGMGIALAVLAMGVAPLILGTQWEAIRAVLLDRLGPLVPRDRLPPAHRREADALS